MKNVLIVATLLSLVALARPKRPPDSCNERLSALMLFEDAATVSAMAKELDGLVGNLRLVEVMVSPVSHEVFELVDSASRASSSLAHEAERAAFTLPILNAFNADDQAEGHECPACPTWTKARETVGHGLATGDAEQEALLNGARLCIQTHR